MYMQKIDAKSDNGGVVLPKLYAYATETGKIDKQRPITSQEFIDEQVNYLYCLQVSSTVCFPGSTYTYDRKGIQTGVAPIDGSVQKFIFMSFQARLLHQSD